MCTPTTWPAHGCAWNPPFPCCVRACANHSVGHFKGAVDPGTRSFGDFAAWVEDNADELRDKTVMMYCTGGIRCEKASAFARECGIKNVYQLAGGIHR